MTARANQNINSLINILLYILLEYIFKKIIIKKGRKILKVV